MNIENKVAQLVAEKIAEIERPDLFLVSAALHTNGNLIVLLDGDAGIGIAECAQISRYVGFKLEEEDVIKTPYNLEVSSPGVDTPLTMPRQYAKNIGREVAIKTTDGTKREGRLNALTEDAVIIEQQLKQKGKKAEVTESVIPMSEITETKVLISFK